LTILEDDLLEADLVSLCSNCAKNAELKAMVESDLGKGVCGVCCRTDVPVFNPEKFQAVVNLIRALVRFHFDEPEYNGHWGGTSIGDILLETENPIMSKCTCTDYQDDLVARIEEDGGVYPDYDKGICLYAGHDEHAGRLLQLSIPNTFPESLGRFRSRLQTENFYAVQPDLEDFVSKFAADLESRIEKGAIWYRARTGVKKVFSEHNGGFEYDTVYVPYTCDEIGALPPPKANLGRMNRAGVSVLYLANQIDTAIAEIRPHPDHLISVGGFVAARDLRVAKFNVSISDFCASDERLDLFSNIYHIDSLMGSPVTPEGRHKYLLTQLLSEVLIKRGFDAVSFRSSVGGGQNLCAFEPAVFTFDEKHSLVKRVKELRYEISDERSTLVKGAAHYEISSPEA
tara:strand:+ start:10058 stop:11257 length:1200 start_codon:yes stop_codon:yes gene_type:complete